MIHAKRLALLTAIALLGAASLVADTIYQTNAQGKRVVIQRHAIVVKEDSSSLVYKHFDLKERRVVKAVLNQGSLPYEADRGNSTDHRQILDIWRRFGYTATVTDQSGKAIQVADAYVDFYPPGGRGSLLESVPPRTTFPLLLDGGGADDIEFSDIDRIEFQGEHLKVTLRNGQVKEGKFLMPTQLPAEARFLGITDRYDPVNPDVFDCSLPLSRLKEVRFEH